MKRTALLLCVIVGLGAAGRVAADTIYLKTGGVIEGKIFYNKGGKIKVRTAGHAILVFDLETQVERFVKDEKDGSDYLKRTGGVKGAEAHNPFKKKAGATGTENDGENPYLDTTELTVEEEAAIKVQIAKLQRTDNKNQIRAKTKLIAMGYKAGRLVQDGLTDPKPRTRQRTTEILQAIGYKPAVPTLISKALHDADGFARTAAIDALSALTGNTFSFRSNDPLNLRVQAIGKWEKWWAEEEAKYASEEEEEDLPPEVDKSSKDD
ncbi:MAG: HEAT repeat domain-containing protein [Planctomycetota bacterium]|nr:HEAT repeat domain-containing protein [Planctomycetota bacterium]